MAYGNADLQRQVANLCFIVSSSGGQDQFAMTSLAYLLYENPFYEPYAAEMLGTAEWDAVLAEINDIPGGS